MGQEISVWEGRRGLLVANNIKCQHCGVKNKNYMEQRAVCVISIDTLHYDLVYEVRVCESCDYYFDVDDFMTIIKYTES